ncbi:uncharacterized protein LOC114288471 [Camellia sinensis]|uniref:uncharacterized protein LOC114288471 n=1 Tax=Camellia sinensis TaxID=4442 RepID=UPI0010356765|nr:uncharacterized protein LOC114288471 [Camellia sinensis]
MNNITIFGHMDGDLRRTVQFLQERNVNVVIHDEHDLNVIRVREAKEKEIAKALLKKNEKTTVSGKGKENACSVAHNNNVISKAALAQRARRERKRNDKASSSYQLGQRLRRERERSREWIPPSTTNTPPAQKAVMFTHLPSPSTSLASQRNWPTHANPLLHETRNIGVVIRDECNLNIIRNSKAKEKEKAKAMSKGKEKATSFDKGKENACTMVYIQHL